MNDSISITNNNNYQNENILENYQIENSTLNVNNEIPSTLLVCRLIQNQESLTPFKLLFDSGGSHTMIHSRCLPPGATPSLLQHGTANFQTVAGLLASNRQVFLSDIKFPEFDKTKRISGATAHVFDSEYKYDMIIGRDFLHKIGLNICFEKNKCVGLTASCQ